MAISNADNNQNTHQRYTSECEYELYIINYRGTRFKISESFFTSISIYESLFEDDVMKGEITISDAAGFEERLPIIGQEKIEITFNNKRLPESRVKHTFFVYKMSEKIVIDRVQQYNLYFVSEEYLINLKKKISKSYKGMTTSEIAANIYENYIVKDVTTDLYKPLFFDKIGDSDNSFYLNHFVFPRIRPFQAINMIAKKSSPATVNVKENESTGIKNKGFSFFCFYENRDGFWFKSVSDLLNPLKIEKQAEFRYSKTSVFQEKGDDAELLSEQDRNENRNRISVSDSTVSSSVRVPMATYVIVPQNNYGYTLSIGDISVKSYRFISTFDIISNIVGGMYGSKLLTYDPITQQIGENYESQNHRTSLTNFSQGRTDKAQKIFKNNSGIREYQYGYLEDFYRFRNISENSEFENTNHPLATSKNPGINGYDASYKFRTTNFGHGIKSSVDLLLGVMTGRTTKFVSFDNQVERYILSTNAQKRFLKNIIVNIKVSGDQNRKIGEVVQLKIPSSYYTNNGVSDEHTFYQGNYLITKLKHTINQDSTYTSEMELVKDTLFTKLPEDVDGIVDDTTNPYGSGMDQYGNLIEGSTGTLGGGV